MHVGKIEETSGEVTLENDCYKIFPAGKSVRKIGFFFNKNLIQGLNLE